MCSSCQNNKSEKDKTQGKIEDTETKGKKSRKHRGKERRTKEA